MKKRTLLLDFLQQNIKRPDVVYYSHVNESIEVIFVNEYGKDIFNLSYSIIDNQVLMNHFCNEIKNLYRDLPAYARANDCIKLVEKWNSRLIVS